MPYAGCGRDAAGRPWGGLLESPHSGRAYRTLAAPVAAHWAALGRACGIVPTARVACVWDLGPCEEGGSDV